MEILGVAGVASISVITYLIGEIVKATPVDNRWIPVICGLFGAVLGAVLAVMRVMLFCFIANIIISNAEFLGADALRSIDPQKTLIFAFFSGNRLFSFFLK